MNKSGRSTVGDNSYIHTAMYIHETAQGVRFAVSESARREILSRLLGLNHERYEEEQKAAGEAQKAEGGKPKKVKKSKSTDGQMGLL